MQRVSEQRRKREDSLVSGKATRQGKGGGGTAAAAVGGGRGRGRGRRHSDDSGSGRTLNGVKTEATHVAAAAAAVGGGGGGHKPAGTQRTLGGRKLSTTQEKTRPQPQQRPDVLRRLPLENSFASLVDGGSDDAGGRRRRPSQTVDSRFSSSRKLGSLREGGKESQVGGGSAPLRVVIPRSKDSRAGPPPPIARKARRDGLGVPAALEVSLLRSSSYVTAEEGGGEEGAAVVHRRHQRQGAPPAAASSSDPHHHHHSDPHEQLDGVNVPERVAAVEPIVTEEWARSVIKPGEEYLLYTRTASGYQQGKLAASATSAAAGRQIEEDARRRQATRMLLANRQAAGEGEGSRTRVYRSTGVGFRANPYSSTTAASLGRAPTVHRVSSISTSLACSPTPDMRYRSHTADAVETPSEVPLTAADETPLPPSRQPSSSFCRVISPLPNPSSGYRLPEFPSPLPSQRSPLPRQQQQRQQRQQCATSTLDFSDNSALSASREGGSGGYRGPSATSTAAAVGSGGTVKPNASVMRRRSTPVLFVQPTIAPNLFQGASTGARLPRDESAAASLQQRQDALRQQSAGDRELMLNLRARILSQQAASRDGSGNGPGRSLLLSTEAYPRLPDTEQQPPSALPSLMSNYPAAATGAKEAEGNAGQLFVGRRRRPDIMVSVDALRSLDAGTTQAAATAVAPAATGLAPTRATAIDTPSSKSSGNSASRAVVSPTAAGAVDEATAQLLNDPFFPFTSEENCERLYLHQEEYLSRKKLRDKLTLLHYYANAEPNAPLPPSLLSTPSDKHDDGGYDQSTGRDGEHSLYGTHGTRGVSAADLSVDSKSTVSANVGVVPAAIVGPAWSARISGKTARPTPVKERGGAPKPKKTATRNPRAAAPAPAPTEAKDASPTEAKDASPTSVEVSLLSLIPLDTASLCTFADTERPAGGGVEEPRPTTGSGGQGAAGDAHLEAPAAPPLPPLEHPSRHSQAEPAAPCRASLGKGPANGGSLGSHTSPCSSPPSSSSSPQPQSQQTGVSSSAFIVNAVMPTAKTGPIAALSTSSLGFMGAAAAVPATGASSSGSASVGSSRANSVGQQPLLPPPPTSADRRASSVAQAGCSLASSQRPSHGPANVSTKAPERLLKALHRLLPQSSADGGCADTLREFVLERRQRLIDRGLLLAASAEGRSPAEAATAASPLDNAQTPPGGWDGTAAEPFMKALRREALLEDTPPGAPTCVEVDDEAAEAVREGGGVAGGTPDSEAAGGRGGGGSPRPYEEISVEARRRGEEPHKSAAAEADAGGGEEEAATAAALGEANKSRVVERDDETPDKLPRMLEGEEEDGAVEGPNASNANLDDGGSHQRNVEFVLAVFGAFLKSPTAGLPTHQPRKKGSAKHRSAEKAPLSRTVKPMSTAAPAAGVPLPGRMSEFLVYRAEGAPREQEMLRGVELLFDTPHHTSTV